MRNRIIIVGGAVFLAYVLGSRAATTHKSESVGHQIVRLWSDPKAKKSRSKKAKKVAKAARKRTRALVKSAKKRASAA